MVIVGLIIPMVWGFLTAQLLQSRVDATKGNQELIKQALQRYAAANGRLPCPAPVNLASTAANFGAASREPPVDAGVTCNLGGVTNIAGNTVYRGLVPWATLGIPESQALDGFDGYYTYYVSRAAIRNPSALLTPAQRLSPGSSINGPIIVNNGVTNIATGVVAAIISHGINGYGAYTYHGAGAQKPAANGGAREQENTNNNVTLTKADYAESGTNQFDDIVIWLSADDALALSATTDGGAKPASQAVRERAFNLVTVMARDTKINGGALQSVRGGIGPFTVNYFPVNAACDTGARTISSFDTSNLGITAADVLDPWSLPYRFSRGRTDLNSSGTCSYVITIVSAGPDGAFNTADDVQLPYSTTTYTGLVAKF
ncbi:hypothetical protein CSQ89_17580 [Chitinimonas sp. BJB300]|nr:hypothetical protein CSQ89_17580 [Chitinimonas sp. BJB300]